jgi:IMP cyclohydrolase
MYIGRMVAIGKNKIDQIVAMYRVSSRSFPNREIKVVGSAMAVVPKQGFEGDLAKNPYIAYNCLRLVGDYAVVGNGTHVDPIAEKLETGMRMRDAMVLVLHAMDYEHDQLETPRITAVVNRQDRQGILGIVRRDALLVQEVALNKGEAYYLATYTHNYPGGMFRDGDFDVVSADEACEYVLSRGVFAEFENPVSAACAMSTEQGFSMAYKEVGGAEA